MRNYSNAFLNNKYRIVKDLEVLGVGFVRNSSFRKGVYRIYRETVFFNGDKANILVRCFNGYEEIFGPDNDIDSYKRLNHFLNELELETSNGFRRRLLFRQKIQLFENYSSVLVTLAFMWLPINNLFSLYPLWCQGAVHIGLWLGTLGAIRGVAHRLKRM